VVHFLLGVATWPSSCQPFFLGSATRPPSCLSVRKVVPTLTSKSAEIDLLMAGAKQHYDTEFILVPVVGRTSSRGALGALYCKALWCS
jgi:hypothetical protein